MTPRLESIAAAFAKHGPMRAEQLRKFVDVEDLTQRLQLGASASPQLFARLHGQRRGTVWGLPTQTMADVKAPKPDALKAGAELGRKDKPPRSIHARKTKKSPGGGPLQCGVNA